MITTEKGATYEIFLGGTIAEPLYYAHAHCWCSSTLGSGEWWPTIERAVAESRSNMDQHVKAGVHAAVRK